MLPLHVIATCGDGWKLNQCTHMSCLGRPVQLGVEEAFGPLISPYSPTEIFSTKYHRTFSFTLTEYHFFEFGKKCFILIADVKCLWQTSWQKNLCTRNITHIYYVINNSTKQYQMFHVSSHHTLVSFLVAICFFGFILPVLSYVMQKL